MYYCLLLSLIKMISNFIHPSRLKKFEALQHCLVPRSRNFTESQKKESVQLVNHFLSHKPSVHFKLSFFLFLIDLVSIFFGGRTFTNLSEVRQNKVMNFFFDSPIPLLRKGFWGLNALIKMSVYGQKSVYDDIGYHQRKISHV